MDMDGKLARWRLRFTEFEFDDLHTADIEELAADALSRLKSTRKDDTTLNDDGLIATILNDKTSDCRSPDLAITDARYGWHTKPVSADETDVFTLE